MENSIDIACLGSANCDFFLEVKDFPQEGETIQAVKSFTMNGGKGANQAVAAGKLAGKSLFVGQLGKDDKGKGLEDEMNAAGVSLKHVRKIDGEPSGHAYIMLNSKRQNIIIIVGGANMAYKDTSVLPDEYKHAISESKFLLLQREIPHEINVLAAKFAHENKKKVMLDFGGRDDPFPPEILNYLDFLSPNETELERVLTAIGAEGQGVNAIKEVLLKKFPHLVVILKLGADGCRVITTEIDVETKTVNKYNPQIQKDLPIVNTTGAGDCFTAAFVVKYNESVSDDSKKDKDTYAKLIKDCCLFANSSAYLCITKEGAMPSMPFRKDVDSFMEKYLKDIKA